MKWSEVPLSTVASIRAGGRLGLSGKDFVPQGVPAWGAGGQNGLVSEAEGAGPAVVLSSVGARCGKCFFVDGQWTTLANTQLITPEKTKVDPRFLWHQLNDEHSWHRSGTGQPFIKPADVKRRRVRLPPLDEQRRLAALLDRSLMLRLTREKALSLGSGLESAAFRERFGELHAAHGYGVRRFGELIGASKIGLSRASSELRADPTWGTPYVRMDAISLDGTMDLRGLLRADAAAEENREYSLRPGDLCFNTRNSRPLVGKCAVFRGQGAYLFNNNILRIRLSDAARPDYVSALLRTRYGLNELEQRKSGTTAVVAIYEKNLRSLPVPLPPIGEQRAFEEDVDHIAGVRSRGERGLRTLDRLVSSLRRLAMRGDL